MHNKANIKFNLINLTILSKMVEIVFQRLRSGSLPTAKNDWLPLLRLPPPFKVFDAEVYKDIAHFRAACHSSKVQITECSGSNLFI